MHYFPAQLRLSNLPAGSSISLDFSLAGSSPDPAKLFVSSGEPGKNGAGIQVNMNYDASISSVRFTATGVNLEMGMSDGGEGGVIVLDFHFGVSGDLPKDIFLSRLNLPNGASLTLSLNGTLNSTISSRGQDIVLAVG